MNGKSLASTAMLPVEVAGAFGFPSGIGSAPAGRPRRAAPRGGRRGGRGRGRRGDPRGLRQSGRRGRGDGRRDRRRHGRGRRQGPLDRRVLGGWSAGFSFSTRRGSASSEGSGVFGRAAATSGARGGGGSTTRSGGRSGGALGPRRRLGRAALGGAFSSALGGAFSSALGAGGVGRGGFRRPRGRCRRRGRRRAPEGRRRRDEVDDVDLRLVDPSAEERGHGDGARRSRACAPGTTRPGTRTVAGPRGR